ANKFYKFAIYGKFGTGKTTFLTKDNNALVLDINEDGTTVTEDGAVVSVKNYKHFSYVIKSLPQILEKLSENGKERDVGVIDIIQKLIDMTINDVMKGKNRRRRFSGWVETPTRIFSICRGTSILP